MHSTGRRRKIRAQEGAGKSQGMWLRTTRGRDVRRAPTSTLRRRNNHTTKTQSRRHGCSQLEALDGTQSIGRKHIFHLHSKCTTWRSRGRLRCHSRRRSTRATRACTTRLRCVQRCVIHMHKHGPWRRRTLSPLMPTGFSASPADDCLTHDGDMVSPDLMGTWSRRD